MFTKLALKQAVIARKMHTRCERCIPMPPTPWHVCIPKQAQDGCVLLLPVLARGALLLELHLQPQILCVQKLDVLLIAGRGGLRSRLHELCGIGRAGCAVASSLRGIGR